MVYQKKFSSFVLAVVVFFISFSYANAAGGEKIFRAEVEEILAEKTIEIANDHLINQQNIKLRGIEGEFLDQEIIFEGISSAELLKSSDYKVGDLVLVAASPLHEGGYVFYITDYVRTGSLWYLSLFFVAVLLIVGRMKGLRSLVALVVTFLIIIKFIVPKILAGSSPVAVTLIGSTLILLAIIYLTEGLNRKSHIAVFSIFISLIITIITSQLFIGLAHLSGIFSEEVSFLVAVGDATINFKGLLLAGIIIGALGVLDDVVISQISTVEEILKTDPSLDRYEVFKKAYRVGVSHISSMTNTLFLAYAGVSLPILILLISGQSAFATASLALNNEAIATEIVRALCGSVGLILSVPIATYIAAIKIKVDKRHLQT